MARHRGFYKRGAYYWCRTDPVTRKPISTRCKTVAGAEAWLREREAIATGAHDPVREAQEAEERKRNTLGLWVQKTIALKQYSSSDSTVEVYKQKLGHWVRVFGADMQIADVDPGTFDKFLATRREDGVTDHTISKELVCMTQVLKLAKRSKAWAGDIQTLRPMGIRVEYEPQKRNLTREELLRLLANLDPKRGAYVALCVGLGVRRAEVERLLPTDFNWAKGEVFIGGTKTKRSKRTVPILSLYRPLLDGAMPFLPVGKWGNAIRDLERACRRAGIDRCTRNDLRRTHSTMLHAAGVDRDTIRRLLGHASAAMVDKTYSQPSPGALGVLAERQLATVEPLAIRYTDGDPELSGPPESARNADNATLAQLVEQRFRKPSVPASDSQRLAKTTGAAGRERRETTRGEALGASGTLHDPLETPSRAGLAKAASRLGVLCSGLDLGIVHDRVARAEAFKAGGER